MSYPDKCVRARARATRRAPLFLIPSPPGSSRQVHPDVGAPTLPPSFRFYAAVDASRLPAIESKFSDETRLVLYALRRQATDGPCEPRSRWGMSQPERAKHDTWLNLGKMESFEAMRLFVKLMDEERPRWWEVSPAAPAEPRPDARPIPSRRSPSSHPRSPGLDPRRVDTHPGRRHAASPRYQHATVIVNHRVYIVGGSYRGRFIGDVHEFDLDTSSWRRVECVMPRSAGSALAVRGHRLGGHRGAVYLVGGRFKGDEREKYLTLMRMDIVTGTDPRDGSGEPRPTRFGAPAETTVLSLRRVEDTARPRSTRSWCSAARTPTVHFLGTRTLDLKTMTWRAIEPGATLARPRTLTRRPRRGRNTLAAAAWGDDALLIFGGTGASFKCFAGVHALDIRAGVWERLRPEGPAPGPRARPRGATVDVGSAGRRPSRRAPKRGRRMSPRSISTRWNGSLREDDDAEAEAQHSRVRSSWAVQGMSLNAVASEDGEPRSMDCLGPYLGLSRRAVFQVLPGRGRRRRCRCARHGDDVTPHQP